nr:hypothetical protein [Tanacetum cinerariifolium]
MVTIPLLPDFGGVTEWYQEPSVIDVPLLLDHAFDFFAVEPVLGLAEAPDNQNGWIEWDVPLGGEMDEPMKNPEFDEEEELNEFMDDDHDEEVIDDLCVRMSNLEYRGDPSSSNYFGRVGTDLADLIAWSLVSEPAVAD